MPSNVGDSSASRLLHTFLAAVERSCGFLEAEWKLTRELSLQVLTQDGLRSVKLDQVSGDQFFFAQVAFFGESVRIELTYGDRDFTINACVGRALAHSTPAPMYGLWEWLDALGMGDARSTGGTLVTKPKQVQELVSRLARVLRERLQAIVQASGDTIQRMDEAREARRQANENELSEREHQRVAADAAKAFRARDYRKVVALLESMEGRLTESELKKLDYARRRCGEAPCV